MGQWWKDAEKYSLVCKDIIYSSGKRVQPDTRDVNVVDRRC